MPSADDIQFGRMALAHSFVTREELAKALREQERQRLEQGESRKLGDILVSMGLVTQAQVGQLLAEQAGQTASRNLGGFELLERIGSGGMGAVYRARQTVLNRIVALKVLPQRLATDRDFIARFYREARAVARLSHPNIVSGIDVGEADGYHYLAMEFVDGGSAADLLQQFPAGAPADRLIYIARQVACALEHAHQNGIIHRDIKPENILTSREGVVKLCDLGLARSAGGDDVSLTQAGMAVGTPHYISPEQARGRQDIDPRADIYSFGASLFHLATGRPLFTGDNAQQVMTKHIEEPAPLASEVAPSVPSGLAAIIAKMLAKRREDRYASMTQVLEDLDRIADGQAPRYAPVTAGQHPRPYRPATRQINTSALRAVIARRRRPYQLLLGIGAAALIALAGGVAFLALRGRSAADPGRVPPSTGPQTGPTPPEGTGNGGERTGPGKPAAAAAKELEVKRLLEDAKRFAAANPTEFTAQAERYEAVARICPRGSPSLRSAASLASEARERLAAAVAESFRRIQDQVAEMASKRRFGDALKLLGSLPQDLPYRDDPVMVRLAAGESAKIGDAAAKEWAKIEGDCDAKVAAQSFDTALAALAPVKEFGIPELTAKAETKARAVTGKRDNALLDARRQAEKAYREFLPAFRTMVGNRRYQEAEKVLADTVKRLPPDLAARLEADRRDLEVARDVYGAAVQRVAPARPNESLTLRLKDGQHVSGKFSRFDENSRTVWVWVTSHGVRAEKDVAVDRISARCVLELAGLTGEERTSDQIRRAMVFTALDDSATLDEVREVIGAAKLKGLPTARYDRRIGEISQAELERAAESRLKELTELAGAGRWAEAHNAAEELLGRKYETSATVLRHGAEIARIKTQAAENISARSRRVLVLQRGGAVPELGIAYYSGTADTSILAPPATVASVGGADRLMVCGEATERSLLRFDLSSVPRRVNLESASLELFCLTASYQQDGSKLRALRLASDWEEGVRTHALGRSIDGATWANRRASGGGAAWTSPGGDIDDAHDSGLGPGVVAEADGPSAGEWVRLDVTSAVRGMLAGKDRNFGFLLVGRSNQSGKSTRWIFASGEAMDDRPDARPRLVLQLTGLSFTPGPEPHRAAVQAFSFESQARQEEFLKEFDIAGWPDGKSLRDTTRFHEGLLRIGRPRGAAGLVAKRQWGRDSEVFVRLKLGVPAVVGFAFDPALPDSGASALRFLHYPTTSSVSGQLSTALDRSLPVQGALGVLTSSSDPPPRRNYFSKNGTYELRAVKEGQRLRLFSGGHCLAEAGLSARDAQAVADSRIRIVVMPLTLDPPLTFTLREVRIGPAGPPAEPAQPASGGNR